MNFQDWKESNPNKSINDFYADQRKKNEFHNPQKLSLSSSLMETKSEQNIGSVQHQNIVQPPVRKQYRWDKNLPLFVRNELSNMPTHRQVEFFDEYKRKRKSILIGYILWFFVGWHYAYIGKWGLLVLYILSVGGLLIWLIADLFRMPSIIHKYNRDLATKILMQMQTVNAFRYA